MSQSKAFHEILREKMNEITLENIGPSHSNSKEYLHFNFKPETELLSIDIKTVIFNSKENSNYRKQQSAKININRPQQIKPQQVNLQVASVKTAEVGVSYDSLSVSAQVTLHLLGLAPDSENKIMVSKVKAVYRKRAMGLHPDLNPTKSSAPFTELKEAVELLLKEMKSLGLSVANQKPPSSSCGI